MTGVPRRHEVTPDHRAVSPARAWLLPAAVAASILAAGALWWTQDRTAPVAPPVAVAPVAAPTMRITAPGADSSAGVGSDKSATGTEPPAGAPSAAGPPTSAAAPTSTGTTKKPPADAPPKASVNSSGRNLALGSRATASSAEGSGWGAAMAVDNDTTTRWSSGFSDPQWLTVDLGKAWEISEVLLRWENAHATAYRVDLSTDGKKWKQVYSIAGSGGGDVTVQVPKVPARLIRMYGTARSTEYGYSLLEIEVR